MSSILVVEDEAPLAELVAINLRYAGHDVVLAESIAQAQAAVEGERPDLVLLDWMLPGGSGLALLRDWRADAHMRDLPVIMLTARGEEADRIVGLDAGADDYLAKPFSTRELLARIRAVLRRDSPADEEALRVGPLVLDPATVRVTRQDGDAILALRLGATEFRLLHFFMAHPERVHTRAQIAARVWGHPAEIEERTIDVHIKRLRQALQPADAAWMIETVRGTGYRMTAWAAAGDDGRLADPAQVFHRPVTAQGEDAPTWNHRPRPNDR